MNQATTAQLAQAARDLAVRGLVRGTSGNLSVREGDLIAVTPTGAQLSDLQVADVAVVDRAGAVVDGPLAPTSELDLHLALYSRYDCGAVVHTHAPVATALSLVIDELPVVHYEQLLLGGSVRVAPYATFGTPELAAVAVDAIEGRTATILANHGTLTHGATLDDAVRATLLLEWVSELYWRAAAIGTPRSLDADQAQAVIVEAAGRGYGQTQPVAAGEAR